MESFECLELIPSFKVPSLGACQKNLFEVLQEPTFLFSLVIQVCFFCLIISSTEK
jgi:hypothetical protein